jgi:hypothetical protein
VSEKPNAWATASGTPVYQIGALGIALHALFCVPHGYSAYQIQTFSHDYRACLTQSIQVVLADYPVCRIRQAQRGAAALDLCGPGAFARAAAREEEWAAAHGQDASAPL